MSNTYTNLPNLSLGNNEQDVVTLSSSGISVTSISSSGAISGTNISASGFRAIAIGAATGAANIASLPIVKSFYRMSSATNVNLKGIAAGANGQELEIYFKSGGTATLTITPQSTAAAVAARIVIMTTAATLVTTGSGYASFIYSSTDTKWLCKFIST